MDTTLFKGTIVTPNDPQQIADLHTHSWQKFYRGIYSDAYLDNELPQHHLKKWQERFRSLDEGNSFIRGIFNNKHLMGFIYAVASDKGVFIDAIHVKSSYQGHGIGGALMAEVARWSVRMEKPLYLEVFASNKNAINFYERCGGKKTDEFTEELSDGSKTQTLVYQWWEPQLLLDKT